MPGVIIAVIWAAAVLVGAMVGSHKGFLWGGIALAFVFSWIGVIIAACIPATQEKKVERAQQQMAIWQAAQQRMLPPQPPQQWGQQGGGQ
jgi:hypothetical protein